MKFLIQNTLLFVVVFLMHYCHSRNDVSEKEIEYVTEPTYTESSLHCCNNTSDTLHIAYYCNIAYHEQKAHSESCSQFAPGKYCSLYSHEDYFPNATDVFQALMDKMNDKQLVIMTQQGDVIASWTDSSAVFQSKYWAPEVENNESHIYCRFTLHLTDELLKLK